MDWKGDSGLRRLFKKLGLKNALVVVIVLVVVVKVINVVKKNRATEVYWCWKRKHISIANFYIPLFGFIS
jgi:hypothetical protein